MKKLTTFCSKLLSKYDHDLVCSAFFAGCAIYTAMTFDGTGWIIPLMLSWHHWQHRSHRLRTRELVADFRRDIMIYVETIDELADELSKVAGPKLTNDILRKCITRLQDDKDKKDPPKTPPINLLDIQPSEA